MSDTSKNVLITILIIAVLIAGGIGLKVIFFPVHTLDKSIDVAYGVVDKTMDADNAIYNYEWFKEQEAYIKLCMSNEENAQEEWSFFLDQLPEEREKWTRDDKAEEASLRNSYYALQKLTNKAIEDYNARASMKSRNIFKELPSNITRAWIAGQNLTD
jgi:hypothetical protein